MDTELTIVGRVRSSYTDKEACPKQGTPELPPATIDIEEAYHSALMGLQPGMELQILTWLHLGDRSVLQCHPRGDPANPLHGVFATRSPDRPNPVGLHRVRLLEARPGSLMVHPLEAVSGTPVVDIKPVVSAGLGAPWGQGIDARDGEELRRIGRLAWEKGLVSGFNGNLSMKRSNRVILTCAGSAKGHLRPGDLVSLDLETGKPLGTGRMSSEAGLHLAVYRSHSAAEAIVHSHPEHLLALSLASPNHLAELPLFEAKACRRALATVPGLSPGSRELALAAAEAAREHQAVFLHRHGLVCWGKDLTEALAWSEELESLAKIQLLAGGRSSI
jgi:L-fuculose-phosphate aldolase